jgi:hypothetical protein
MKRLPWPVVIATMLALITIWTPSQSLAQDPTPPAVGETIFADDLSKPDSIAPVMCSTKRASLDYVGEGLRIKLTGRCSYDFFVAGFGPTVRGLTFSDGEVRLDVKVVSGVGRVRVGINARNQPFVPGSLSSPESVPESFAVAIEPGIGRGLIGNPPHGVINRTDLSDVISVDDWNTIAVRAKGTEFWLLVNEQVVLYTSDASPERGDVSFSVLRLSPTAGQIGVEGRDRMLDDPDDRTEVAAVFRNLTVSALADANNEPGSMLQTR